MKIRFLGMLASLVATVALAQTYSIFSPGPSGPVKSNGSYALQAETSADIIGLWTGTCNLNTFLSGSGACSNPVGGSSGQIQYNNGGTVFGGASTLTYLSASGQLSVAAATGVPDISITAPSGQYGISLQGNATAGNSLGLRVLAGTNSSDTALLVANAAGTQNLAKVFGDGGFVLGSATGGDKGLGTINMTGCFVNNVACSTSGGSVSTLTAATGITLSPNPITTSGTVAVDQTFSPTWTGFHTFSASTTSAPVELLSSAAGGALMEMFNSSNPATNKCWIQRIGSTGTWALDPCSDTGVDANNFAVAATRTGTAVSSLLFGTATDNPAFSFQGTGAGTVNGPWTFQSTAGAGANVNIVANGTTNPLTVTGSAGRSALMEFSANGLTPGITSMAVGQDSAGNNRILGRNNAPLLIGTNNTTHITDATTGQVTITAPTAGSTLTLTGISGQPAITVNSPASGVAPAYFSQSLQIGLAMNSSGTNYGFLQNDSSNKWCLATSTALTALGTDVLCWNNTGTVSIPAPTAGSSALTLNGTTSAYTEVIQASTTAGQGNGVRVFAGTNSSDFNLVLTNAAQTTNYLLVHGDGGVEIGSPTGGNQGLGTLNMQGCFVNGVACGGATGSQIMVTLAGASAPAITTSRNCTSPSVARNSVGSYTISCSNVAATGTNMGLCSIDSSSGGPFAITVSLATGQVNFNTFITTTGALTDPASGAHMRCLVAS